MWELDFKESLVLKKWCSSPTVVLEKTFESPLDCKEIQPVHPKGNQSWIFIGKDWCRSWNSNTLATWCEELTHWERPWCWERLKAGGEGDDDGWWHHWLNGHVFELALGVGDGLGSLVFCSPWRHKEMDTTEWLNWTGFPWIPFFRRTF